MIKKYKPKQIETTAHTFFRISQRQRKVYTDETLKHYITQERPVEVIKQKNGNLSVLYNFKDTKKIIKIVLPITTKIHIVTFYILNKEQMRNVGK